MLKPLLDMLTGMHLDEDMPIDTGVYHRGTCGFADWRTVDSKAHAVLLEALYDLQIVLRGQGPASDGLRCLLCQVEDLVFCGSSACLLCRFS